MKRILTVGLSIVLGCTIAVAQNSNSSAIQGSTGARQTNSNRKRGPIFRATKDQINQAQALLKQRGFYSGEQIGKLDDSTRAGLKKYQAAENIKVTGTLNKLTLEKMGITLTDQQKTM